LTPLVEISATSVYETKTRLAQLASHNQKEDERMELKGEIAFPLHWPDGRARTKPGKIQEARFKMSFGVGIDHLLDELRRMGARWAVISTNIKGYEKAGVWRPYADNREPDDSGVACYFDLEGDPICLSCDKWKRVCDNVRAIGLTAAAMRGLERWGAAERKQAFAGFKALPASHHDWRTVLDLPGKVDMVEVKKRYRKLASSAHPDQGGRQDDMTKLNLALEEAKRELGA
jgi:hypothetical protein